MRTDYVLYVVAVILFIITGIVAVYSVEQTLWIASTAVLGLFFASLGLSKRPKTQSIAVETTPATTVTVQPTVKEEPKKEETPTVMETPVVTIELTQVKGIKAKRAEQLKALGINNAQDLANATANDLAAKLKIASYFTEQWIENAKKLTGKS
jgi:predicted flap endonuclease-1-like 5' DNA nuclease